MEVVMATPMLIGIAGGTGSGKSTFAEGLKKLYPESCGNGILIGGTNPASIDLAEYAGEMVNVLLVAHTNWGDEIVLAIFNNVIVP